MSWPAPRVTDVNPPPTQPAPHPARRHRRMSIVGLIAGLIGGGAIGLIAVSPGAAGAGNDVPPVVTDDGEGTPVSRLREVLQPLVDDGTLSADQLDAVVSTIEDARPTFPHRVERGGPWLRHRLHDAEEVAALLGMDADELREQLDDGATLAEVAAEHGVDVAAVVDVLVADAEARLDDAVADGRLTEEEAGEHAARVRERVTAFVNGEAPPDLPELPDLMGRADGPGWHRARPGAGDGPAPQT